MEPEDQLTLLGPVTPLVHGTLVEALDKGLDIDVEDEDRVEIGDELREVPGPTAEVRHRTGLVRDQGSDRVHVPEVVLVASVDRGVARDRIASVGQLTVAVDSVEAPPLQLVADRSLASA